MSVIRATPTPRGAGHLLRAVVAAWLLLLALVVPAGAIQGPTKLFDPAVSPGRGTPTTTISFTVEYRNREGSAPAYVRVVIDGKAHDMVGDGGSDWKKGVGHHYAAKLPAGKHRVSFVASDTRKFTDEIAGGTVTIAVAPAPKPTPAPDPTPVPAPDSNAAPGTDPTSGSAGSVGNGTGHTDVASRPGDRDGSPTDESTSGTGTDGSGPSSDHGPVVLAGPGYIGGGTGGPGGGGDSAAGTSGSGSFGSGGSGGSGGAGSGWALASALDALGIDTPSTGLAALPTLVGTTGAVAMAMAFAIFGKKRRDEEQPAPDEVLQANAARGSGVAASGELVRGVVAAAAVPAPIDLEASMPRWRRPSLQQARKADPTRSFTAAPKLRFDETSGAGIGYERRTIRYRVVRLLDAPDELRSVEIGQLDQGDEVQLLEKSGAYWLVRCPDGRQGWLHKMTLGDAVSDTASSEADAWNVGDIDGDVLSAFLAARARA